MKYEAPVVLVAALLYVSISPTGMLSGSFVECQLGPKSHHVNLFEAIHLVKFCGRRDGFTGQRTGLLLGFALGIEYYQLEPIEFGIELLAVISSRPPISMPSSPPSFPGVGGGWKVQLFVRSAAF